MSNAPTTSFHGSEVEWGAPHFISDDYNGTHTIFFGYVLWLVGFSGAHRFYYGKPGSGVLWFFTFGLFGIGWIIDFFLIPEMDKEADGRFEPGYVDYNASWLLLLLAGPLGLHRFVQRKWFTGALFLCTLGLFGVGVVYDVLTMNDQIHEQNLGLAHSD